MAFVTFWRHSVWAPKVSKMVVFHTFRRFGGIWAELGARFWAMVGNIFWAASGRTLWAAFGRTLGAAFGRTLGAANLQGLMHLHLGKMSGCKWMSFGR